MKTEFKNFGLYGREDSMITANFLNLVSIDSSCRKHNWVIKPHFHRNLYQFFFIESGNGLCMVNEKNRPFSGLNIIIMPENNLHGFQFSEDIKGYTLSVSTQIMDKLTQSDKEIMMAFNRVRFLNMSHNYEEFNDAMDSIRRMLKELSLQALKTDEFMETLLYLLLIKIFRINTEAEKDYVPSTRELQYYKEFIKNLKKVIPTNRSIEDYTKLIGISKTHLNRVCQSIAGKSTKQVINNYLTNESMVLMAHTAMTISEIAHQLEFKDVSYFCRFFKKQTNVSPAKFREENRNIATSDSLVALNY
jgi:AraC family transcriptional regulator, transcriptional activator of pobA